MYLGIEVIDDGVLLMAGTSARPRDAMEVTVGINVPGAARLVAEEDRVEE